MPISMILTGAARRSPPDLDLDQINKPCHGFSCVLSGERRRFGE
jgi:hypothetical protein